MKENGMVNSFSLSQLFLDIENIPWDEALFLPINENWSLETNAIIFATDDLDDDKEVPDIAAEHNMDYVCGISTVQDIVRNVKLQKPDCTAGDIMKAFLYYHENDAFLVL